MPKNKSAQALVAARWGPRLPIKRGQALIARLIAAGMTQREIGAACVPPVSDVSVSNWFRGTVRAHPSLAKVKPLTVSRET
jgi:hypothetical protein